MRVGNAEEKPEKGHQQATWPFPQALDGEAVTGQGDTWESAETIKPLTFSEAIERAGEAPY